MACMENVCINPKCGWGDMSNEKLQKCPRCGNKVLNFFDEPIEEHESPSGDDYDDWEDD